MIASIALLFSTTALLQGALVGVSAWLAIRLFRIYSPSARTRLWSAAFFGSALLPFFIFLPDAIPDYGRFAMTLEQATSENIDPEAIVQVAVGSNSQQHRSVSLNDRFVSTILVVWLMGTGWCAARLLRDAAAVRILRRESAAIELRSFGLPSSITARTHPAVPSPFATGVFSPTVIIPANMVNGEDPRALRAALAHEIAHIQRGDLIANFLESLVLCVVWWNFPLHKMRALISENREMACDDYAVMKSGDAGDYASALVTCAQWVSSRRLSRSTTALAIAANTSQLERRVTRISAEGYSPYAPTARSRILLAAATLVFTTTCAAVAAPRIAMAHDSEAGGAHTQSVTQTDAERLGRELVTAVLDNDMLRAEALIVVGADINAVLLRDGTPLIAAVNEDSFRFAAWLIANGADVNAYALYDETALISAARNSSQDMVRLLIDSGADVNQSAKTQTGITRSPLGEARRLQRPQIEAILIAAGAIK